MWKQWKQESTSKEKYIEAMKKDNRAAYQDKCKAEKKTFKYVMQICWHSVMEIRK